MNGWGNGTGLREGFRIVEGFNLPFRALPFACNLYYFVVAEKTR